MNNETKTTKPTTRHLALFDTTLRDGNQTPQINFSLKEKLAIVKILDELKVDYIEAGWPGSNPIDDEFFSTQHKSYGKIVAFGMTKRKGYSIENDDLVNAIVDAQANVACIVGKASSKQVKLTLGMTPDENLQNISQTIAKLVEKGKEVHFDCEHFFDGYKIDPNYSKQVIETAHQAGAKYVVMCDTNGGTLPHEISEIINQLKTVIEVQQLGIHCHNDTGNAIANSLAAVLAGVGQVQGTLNGLGERCGNADLISLIPTLMLKPPFCNNLTLSIDKKTLAKITSISRKFDDIINRSPIINQPYVGPHAFAHKAGLHASAIAKYSSAYEHCEPSLVGNARDILISAQAGRSNLKIKLEKLNLSKYIANNNKINILLNEIKEKQKQGYSFESADGTFELITKKTLNLVNQQFFIQSYRVIIEHRYNAKGNLVTISEASVKMIINNKEIYSIAEGLGPVNAMENAFRKDFGTFSEALNELTLIDYKVRIINGTAGSKATTRVLISFKSKNKEFSTIGLSENIVEASFIALTDAYELHLTNYT